LRGITGLIGPLLFTGTFSLFISERKNLSLPGAPFFLSALLLISAAALAWFVTKPRASPESAKAGAPIIHEKTDPAPLPADTES
jgi:DHA1 family tetracycline resistance protein-like MFS transporter